MRSWLRQRESIFGGFFACCGVAGLCICMRHAKDGRGGLAGLGKVYHGTRPQPPTSHFISNHSSKRGESNASHRSIWRIIKTHMWDNVWFGNVCFDCSLPVPGSGLPQPVLGMERDEQHKVERYLVHKEEKEQKGRRSKNQEKKDKKKCKIAKMPAARLKTGGVGYV